MIITKTHLVGHVFDVDATLAGLAASFGGAYSWGASGNVRLLNTVRGVQLRAIQILPEENPSRERLLAIASTTPQPFDGVYSLAGERVSDDAIGMSYRPACHLPERNRPSQP